MAIACSIGAKVLDPGRAVVLYKNRDLARPRFDDRVVYTPRLFALEGIERWDASGGAGRYLGFSAGINAAGLACADANVATRPGAASSGVLVQLVLERCESIFEAVRLLEVETVQRPYSWANLVLADRHGVAAVEVRDRARVVLHPRQINRANHHLAWRPEPSPCDQDTTTTRWRYQTARNLLDQVDSVEAILRLCRSHDPQPGPLSLCRHGEYTTVYSHVFAWQEGQAALWVCQGSPCQGEYRRLSLRFPAAATEIAATLRDYPSRFTCAPVAPTLKGALP